MSTAPTCQRCHEQLRRDEPRHRVTYDGRVTYFHAGAHILCTTAAMRLYEGGGSIRYQRREPRKGGD